MPCKKKKHKGSGMEKPGKAKRMKRREMMVRDRKGGTRYR